MEFPEEEKQKNKESVEDRYSFYKSFGLDYLDYIIHTIKSQPEICKSDNEIEITFKKKNENLKVWILFEKNKFYLSDLGLTMDFMNEIYEIDVKDVSSCINNITDYYDVSFERRNEKTFLMKEIKSDETSFKDLLCLYDCITQLKAMHLFFDEPIDY
jgi:hypothetical protein